VIKSYDVPGIAGSIPCPLCRSGIVSFRKRAASEEEPPNPASTCSSSSDGHQSSPEKKQGSDQAILPVYCAPFIPPPVVLT
jgi:E3 ubiquitin-protein ligase XBAT32/33